MSIVIDTSRENFKLRKETLCVILVLYSSSRTGDWAPFTVWNNPSLSFSLPLSFSDSPSLFLFFPPSLNYLSLSLCLSFSLSLFLSSFLSFSFSLSFPKPISLSLFVSLSACLGEYFCPSLSLPTVFAEDFVCNLISFISYVLLKETKFSSIRKPCTHTIVRDTLAVRKSASARFRNFYVHENVCMRLQYLKTALLICF